MGRVDAIVIGSGIGGLVAGSLLARYGWRVVVCESHAKPGGAAHGFEHAGFRFDTGPSFFCGLGDPASINPLRQVLTVLGEELETIAYDPLGIYHLPEGDLPIFCKLDRYREAIAHFTPQGAQEFAAFEQRMLVLYEGLRQIPTLSLRPDWRGLGEVLWRYPGALLRLLPQLPTIQGSAGDVLDATVRDPWVRRLVDLECFLLSGLKAAETVAPEVSFMLGERSRSVVDYPLGGGEAIIQALVRGLEAWGGELRLNAHVDKVWVEDGQVRGVKLRRGEVIEAPVVISNATLWDTVTHLLKPEVVPASLHQLANQTAAIDSFMHLHLGIRAEGLDNLCGHHVVLHDGETDLTTPGNTCMISMPSVWDASLAPPGHHVLHAYTLEPFEGWQRDHTYKDKKQARAATLYRAVERVIPDVRDRMVVERIGTPLTHARYLRRHRGTYGPAIAAHQGQFPPPQTPIPGLYRVGDSTLPGIGVPAVAASGILCANALVSPAQTAELLPLIGKRP
ncbi:phytoene desaturase family protein [Vacuolonema iberomarrocanum]|uniref:phytoene desaturase family protein n=1 Tax=Vacuolonema iberomarrocanum TaxID=3454632 RepID=UPI0019EE1500|nr:FAD-dependent oxidoreductase [filamentous cyanobacterium LEGE 07170]